MALACPILEHPVGAGTFCRICGRDYGTVPEPVVTESPAADVLDAPPVAVLPVLPEPSPFAEFHVPAEAPLPADPVLDTGIIQTRFAQMTAPEAPLGDLVAVAPEAEPEPPAAKTPRAVPPVVLHVLAGAGGGAVVMAVLDRLVL